MCGYFGTKKIVLLNYLLGLSLLKYRNVWVFWNKKKSGSNRCSPLNSSIDKPTSSWSLKEKKQKLMVRVILHCYLDALRALI